MAKKRIEWYNKPTWSALLAAASFALSFAMASHSLDTGSWQQYGITFVLLAFGINRTVQSVRTLHSGRR